MIITLAAGRAVPTLLKWDGTTALNVAVDGNSHYAQWVANAIDTVGDFATLMTASSATHGNVAIPGQAWLDMALNAADIDALWSPSRTNVLVIGETTNSVFGGSTGSPIRTTRDQVIQDAQRYIAARRAAHPWIILLCGTIPRGGTVDYAAQNALAKDCDDYMAGNFRDMGAHAYCDLRADPYFDGTGTDTSATAPWMGISGLCLETAVPYIHPLGAARTAFANRIAAALQTLPSAA